MGRRKYSVEEIILHLREIEVLVVQGRTVAEALREIGITEHTYYRWRKQYSGVNVNEGKRLKELEKENLD